MEQPNQGQHTVLSEKNTEEIKWAPIDLDTSSYEGDTVSFRNNTEENRHDSMLPDITSPSKVSVIDESTFTKSKITIKYNLY